MAKAKYASMQVCKNTDFLDGINGIYEIYRNHEKREATENTEISRNFIVVNTE